MRRTDTRSCGREAVKACVRDGSKKVAHHNSHVFFLPGVVHSFDEIGRGKTNGDFFREVEFSSPPTVAPPPTHTQTPAIYHFRPTVARHCASWSPSPARSAARPDNLWSCVQVARCNQKNCTGDHRLHFTQQGSEFINATNNGLNSAQVNPYLAIDFGVGTRLCRNAFEVVVPIWMADLVLSHVHTHVFSLAFRHRASRCRWGWASTTCRSGDVCVVARAGWLSRGAHHWGGGGERQEDGGEEEETGRLGGVRREVEKSGFLHSGSTWVDLAPATGWCDVGFTES